jgi:ribosomal protein L24E
MQPPGVGKVRREKDEKVFFFEKKKQKTFQLQASPLGERAIV